VQSANREGDHRAIVGRTSASEGRLRRAGPYAVPQPPSFFELNGEYVGSEISVGQQSWYVRGQNVCIVLSWLAEGEVLRDEPPPDEHAILLFGESAVEVNSEGAGRIVSVAPALIIVPPGSATVVAQRPGFVVRVYTSRAMPVLAHASNGHDYATSNPQVMQLPAVPAESGPGTIRTYPISAGPGGAGHRLWRTDSMIIDWREIRAGLTDVTELEPQVWESCERVTVSIDGDHVHHVRRPWTARLEDWRADEHVQCSSPSVTVIPPGNINLTRAVGDGPHTLVDVFGPVQRELGEAGVILNQADYDGPVHENASSGST
jgi:hypothetical protein